MDRKEFVIAKLEARNKLIAAWLTGLGVAIALGGAVATALAYLHTSHLETTKQLSSTKLEICREVSGAVSRLYKAANQNDFDRAEAMVEEVKHSDALLVLGQATLNDLTDLVNYANQIDSTTKGVDFQNLVIAAGICNLPLKVVEDCRAELTDAFAGEAEGARFENIVPAQLNFKCELPPLHMSATD
jgi:Ni,Fe-hydrogenase III small subunit